MEQASMTVVAVLLLMALVGYLARHTVPAGQGLIRSGLGHFGFAISLLRRAKWLLWLPLALVLAEVLIVEAPLWSRSRLQNAGRSGSSPNPWGYAWNAVLEGGYPAAIRTLPRLPGGWASALTTVAPLLVLASLEFLLAAYRLERHTAEPNRRRFRFLKKAVWVLLACSLADTAILLRSFTEPVPIHSFLMKTKVVFDLASGPFYAAALAVVMAPVTAGVFLYLRSLANREEAGFDGCWNEALSSLAPLAVVNVLWALVLRAPAHIVLLPYHLWVLGNNETVPTNELAAAVFPWLPYPQGVLALAFWPVSFFVVIRGQGVLAGARSSLALIRRRFLGWALTVAFCLAFLVLCRILALFLMSYTGPYSFWQLPVQAFAGGANSAAIVFCSVALFGFMLRNTAEELRKA